MPYRPSRPVPVAVTALRSVLSLSFIFSWSCGRYRYRTPAPLRPAWPARRRRSRRRDQALGHMPADAVAALYRPPTVLDPLGYGEHLPVTIGVRSHKPTWVHLLHPDVGNAPKTPPLEEQGGVWGFHAEASAVTARYGSPVDQSRLSSR
jgi:hypothetical protein